MRQGEQDLRDALFLVHSNAAKLISAESSRAERVLLYLRANGSWFVDRLHRGLTKKKGRTIQTGDGRATNQVEVEKYGMYAT